MVRRVAVVMVASLVASLGVLAGSEVTVAPPPAGAVVVPTPPVGLSTLAGSGLSGYVDGAAGSARFGQMMDMALDASGENL